MGVALRRLTDRVDAANPQDTSWSELLPLQIQAANERLTERVGRIKLLANRAESSGVKAIRELADLVPLLFVHMSYKSYPDSWFTSGNWDRMGQWLDTLTTERVRDVDTRNVKDVDDWIARLAATGHYLSCSSGTTGKCSIIPANMEDRKFNAHQLIQAFAWSTGVEPKQQYKAIHLTPMSSAFRHDDGRQAIIKRLTYSERPFPSEMITVGQVSSMVTLRRTIADGTARPSEVAAFEATSAARAKSIEDGLKSTAEAIVASRGERMLVMGMVATMYQIAEMVQAMGYSGKDFHPENALLTAGGLKGAKLPPDYREQILNTFNLRPERIFQFYGMQEINTAMPRCRADRYHVPPWLMLLVLDETAERLVSPSKEEIEGRAAFVDLSLDGRWCGLITGDKVRVDYGKCACGSYGPTVHNEIMRYSDMPAGDKINCAGTIDAYVRGAA
jgi:phenylacetate-coenzyme A ligase PaaK-like adenylate-forming protein